MRSLARRTLIFVVAMFALVACQADEEKLAEHMSRGDEYLETDDPAAAIIEYKNVLQIDPNHAAAHHGLSKAYLQNSKVREAFWELRETVRLDAQNLDAKIQLGQLLVLAGDPEEALVQADEAIAIDPAAHLAHMIRGQSLNALKRPDESLEAFQQSVEVAPDESAPVFMLAIAYNARSDPEAAEPLFVKFVEMEPGFRSHTSLANFLSQNRERDDEAEAAYRSAATSATESKDQVRGHAHMAGFYFQRERFDEANAYLETAITEVDDPLQLIYLAARLHLSQGNVEKADALIEQATQANPDDPKPYLILSAYRGRQRDVEGALAAAEKAIEIAPQDVDANLRVAEILVDVGYREGDAAKVTRGREIVEGVLERQPSHPSGLMVKAKIDLAEEKVDDAIAALRAAIDVDPELSQAHYILGTALSLQGEKTAARTELARALEIDAGLLEARRVLARVHASLYEHEYSIEEGRRYLRERPDSVDTRILVAQSLVILNRTDEALAELDQIAEEDRSVDVLFAMGRVHLRNGDREVARDFMTRALEVNPTHHDILRNLLRLDRQEGRFAESVTRINAAVATEPENARLRLLVGVVALIDKRPADAEAAFKKAIEIDPTDVAGYEHLARLFARTGRLPEAVKTYEDAVKVRPNDPNLHHFLGILYQYGGARDKAIERYEDAIKYGPDLAEAKNNLAYIYAEAGENLDRALDLAQEANAALPESHKAADTLGWVLFKRGIPSAAISYLKEAEAGGAEADAPTIATIRYHLALAYESDGSTDKAGEALKRGLSDLDADASTRRASGEPAKPDPEWAVPLRTMLTRLETEQNSS
jgi:tetratricopeptide (TPR) repeat protein